jgi:sec-independent protein translocase protein TatB
MFDVGFWELSLIALVALLVIGPERLPKVARTAGLWIGRGRRMLASVKQDIDREIKADELKEILEKQKRGNPMEEIVEDIRKPLEDFKHNTEEALNPLSDSKPERKPAD